MNIHWFNLCPNFWRIGRLLVKPFNAFNRVCDNGDRYWGFGLLQIGKRHLFYVGHNSVSILFIGQSK